MLAIESWHGVCVTSPAKPEDIPPVRPEENAMKYEMLMLRSLLVTSMLICGLTLGQMF
ncbi:hypothetical protein IM816_17285 [Luteibacter flocculans]|uniref:Uncharacterized protein n=1 Tax=Luteibacter flocculans TaxID=2780091 RepID=A0ABY4T4S5_9GAMM|nr:hypothetical protein [Luteibacter flocculans]URL58320.1 hypothetical protein IM816_17285 [Luteibacter flocculans]